MVAIIIMARPMIIQGAIRIPMMMSTMMTIMAMMMIVMKKVMKKVIMMVTMMIVMIIATHHESDVSVVLIMALVILTPFM